MTIETLYKETRDTKLGITFFRRDPQDNAAADAAIVSRIGPTGPAAGKLNVGERIMTVQGVRVEGPLHAARMLRESEGYMKIGKLPKRDDFDTNLARYQQVEAEAARAAMANALPGQTGASTPRTDAPTPRGPGAASVPSGFGSGLRPLNQDAGASAGPPMTLNMNAIGDNLNTAGAQLSARTQELQNGMAQGLGNLSARMGNFFGKVGQVGELIPTQVRTGRATHRTGCCPPKISETRIFRTHAWPRDRVEAARGTRRQRCALTRHPPPPPPPPPSPRCLALHRAPAASPLT